MISDELEDGILKRTWSRTERNCDDRKDRFAWVQRNSWMNLFFLSGTDQRWVLSHSLQHCHGEAYSIYLILQYLWSADNGEITGFKMRGTIQEAIYCKGFTVYRIRHLLQAVTRQHLGMIQASKVAFSFRSSTDKIKAYIRRFRAMKNMTSCWTLLRMQWNKFHDNKKILVYISSGSWNFINITFIEVNKTVVRDIHCMISPMQIFYLGSS